MSIYNDAGPIIRPESFLKQEFREYKLKVLNGDAGFSPDYKSINKYKLQLDFLFKNLKEDIISGSLSLAIFGLLDRYINDIDVLIKDKDRYPRYIKDGYIDNDLPSENRLGVVSFKYKPGFLYRSRDIKVDFFHNQHDATFIEVELGNIFSSKKIKVHHPLEVMKCKLDMVCKNSRGSSKHNSDLVRILK